ncbi:MAG: phospholipase D-like domain-containing protein [Candidatus Loosdrechtia sp.]|uniref:phospholipase D-like domain-containing protein n=1 Tax=Candidatus Loosdrechtia sp. TaxID=3101272 RepID=UPI003A799C17|nr:MAG: phospholipase D-like domain-containing protein [Candidatus Jettenia sp. AMX2]
MKRIVLIVILGYILASISGVVAHALSYSPQGSIKERLEEGIRYAQHSIEICMHNFAALDIGEKLDAARKRGVRVRVVVLEYDDSGLENSLANTLLSKGFDVRDLKPETDDKRVRNFIILDGRILVTGAYNWMAYHDKDIYDNNVRFYHNADKIHEYRNLFFRLFTEGECAPLHAKQRKQDGKDILSQAGSISCPDAEETRQEYEPQKESAVTQDPVKPVTVTPDGFIDISFEELDRKFGRGSNLSRSEKNELWKEYEGKYVKWSGVVLYRGIGRVDWNRIGVSRTESRVAEVEISFDWRRFEKVMNIKSGHVITYTGRLVSYPWINAPYRLDDGDIKKLH